MSAPHLARMASLSAHGTRVILAALLDAKIVECKGSGRSLLYRLRGDHPLVGSLLALFDAERQASDAILSRLRESVSGDEVLAAWVYGSFARSEDGPGSDIDVVVVTDDGGPGIEDRMRSTVEPLDALLSVVRLSTWEVRELSKGDPWCLSMAGDAITLKGRGPKSFARSLKRQDSSASATPVS